MSNRVEELESQVAELQAAVDGLTEELVETRERLRQLEADDGVDNTRTPDRRESVEPDHAEVEHASDSDPEADPASAEAEADTEVDAEAEAEAEAETEDDDSDGNDIIVA
ncbi:DUF7518 family protein [Haloplanus halobius]|uniref:DUF7518 family protein n=1 Tax=Haloplanus halobius TaxID=2934938 RepID=UPI00200F4E2C|nr:chromosome segregation protein SMC [Haloplanus sp. XH21]